MIDLCVEGSALETSLGSSSAETLEFNQLGRSEHLTPLEHKQRPYYPLSMIRNLNMGSHRASRSSETFARSFSLATSQPPNKRSHLCPKIKSATSLLIRK
jgi:hypothetical protein